MSQIEPIRPESFFAEFLLPLRHANARRNVRYLTTERDAQSYWGPAVSRTGGLEQVPANGMDGAALLERLGRYWTDQRDSNLPKLLPYLRSLRLAIQSPTPGQTTEDPGVSEFVYPMF